MPELEEVLEKLGLLEYLGRLQDEGFERWETVLDITEQDLAALNFKLGHRRKLQREIASSRGIDLAAALIPNQFAPLEDLENEEKGPQKAIKIEAGKGSTPTGKRKYRRHPKNDENAPEKPPSAYVMFANRVRDELKGQNLSFTDIAKLVGERWKVLAPEEKEAYEFQASVAKEKYNSEFEEYKRTEQYQEYMRYLADFKAKTNKESKNNSEPGPSAGGDQPDSTQKRPRLDSIPSGGTVSTPSTISSGTLASTPVSTRPSITGSSVSGSPRILGLSAPLPSPLITAAASSSVRSTINAVSSPISPTGSTIAMDFANPKEPPPPPPPPPRSSHPPPRTQTPESHFLPRIHPTIQSPHIQQAPSYLRHQPDPSNSSSSNTSSSTSSHPRHNHTARPPIVLPTPHQTQQRNRPESFSPMSITSSLNTPTPSTTSSSSSAPVVARPGTPSHNHHPPLVDGDSGVHQPPHRQHPHHPHHYHHNSLPPISSTGYFDRGGGGGGGGGGSGAGERFGHQHSHSHSHSHHQHNPPQSPRSGTAVAGLQEHHRQEHGSRFSPGSPREGGNHHRTGQAHHSRRGED